MAEQVLDISPPTTTNPIDSQVEILKSARERFLGAVTESEELTVLRDFGNAFVEVNSLIKQIPQQRNLQENQSTGAFIAESKTEIQKYTSLLATLKTEFEKVVREKWQARIKYPIDWAEPDAWYALITLAMNHVSAETRLVWDKIVDASIKLDSLTTEVGSILDSILSLFGIKKTNSKNNYVRSEQDIELDRQRLEGLEPKTTAVTLPSIKIPISSTFISTSGNSKKRKWIIVVLCFVVFSIAIITWFSRQYGGDGSDSVEAIFNETMSGFVNETDPLL
jgi:hypothetical protein